MGAFSWRPYHDDEEDSLNVVLRKNTHQQIVCFRTGAPARGDAWRAAAEANDTKAEMPDPSIVMPDPDPEPVGPTPEEIAAMTAKRR